MHAHDAVVHLAAATTPLPLDAYCVRAALDDCRLIYHAQGLRVSVVLRHDLLAAVSQSFFIPLDRFEKAL
jgi:hypothetical protein